MKVAVADKYENLDLSATDMSVTIVQLTDKVYRPWLAK